MPLLRISVLVVSMLLAAGPPVGGEVLRVGTSGDYAPFSRGGEGFDVEVARLLAEDLGVELVWVPFRWPDLQELVAKGVFDVAMGGVTWRPERAVTGWMTRAVAAGGPCVVGDARKGGIAVNRGGILERWTRRQFPDRGDILTVDDNLSLPSLLETGRVSAFVTDSFEVQHFRRPGQTVTCEPPRDRKVYWVAPRRAAELGPLLDSWLRDREAELEVLRRRHFGFAAPREELDHLLDLLARRLAFMPGVATYKRRRGLPIEDLERESRVLRRATDRAVALGMDGASARRFFVVQIELAKGVQRRLGEGVEELDLEVVRPALLRIGDRIAESLARLVPLGRDGLSADRLDLLRAHLEPEEIERLVEALVGVEPAPRTDGP